MVRNRSNAQGAPSHCGPPALLPHNRLKGAASCGAKRLTWWIWTYCTLLLGHNLFAAAPMRLDLGLQGSTSELMALLHATGFESLQQAQEDHCSTDPLLGDWIWLGYPALGQVRLTLRKTTTPGRIVGTFHPALVCFSDLSIGQYSFDPFSVFYDLAQQHLGVWKHDQVPVFHLHHTRQSFEARLKKHSLPQPLGLPPELSQIWSEPHAWPCVALTFDACSTFGSARIDRQVLEELLRLELPSTVFLGGRWASTYPDWVQWLAQRPMFEIGIHGYSHQHMPQMPSERIWLELAWNQYELFSATGRWPTLFRPPYGEITDHEVAIASQLGLTTIQYDITAGDADSHVSAEQMAHWIGSKIQPGSIVVLHMNRPESATAQALPLLRQVLRQRHLQACHVSELLKSYWHHATCDRSNRWPWGSVCSPTPLEQLHSQVPPERRSLFRR